jgi:hypothetical protein
MACDIDSMLPAAPPLWVRCKTFWVADQKTRTAQNTARLFGTIAVIATISTVGAVCFLTGLYRVERELLKTSTPEPSEGRPGR